MRLPLTPFVTALAACLASSAVLQSSLTTAHSWLECTDYRMDPNSNDAKIWNPDKCLGRARCGGEQMKVKFGADTGFNHHDLQCQCKRGCEKDTAPVAKYTPGQRVCLAYPPKNHVAAPCTNAFIPDTGVRITRTKVNPMSDDSFAKDYQQGNGAHTKGQFDYKGFQNCPNFCENMDGALCTMCFDLEKDIAPGQYTFKWVWAFNSEEDVYTSCWEAQVGGDGAAAGRGNGNGNQGNSSIGSHNNGYGNQEGTAAPTPTPSPAATPAPVPQVTPSAPSPTPTVTTVTAGATNGDKDCEDELDMAGGDGEDCEDGLDMAKPPVASDADCEDELDMAEPSDADCEDELKMPGGDEVGADADTSAGGYGSGNGANQGNPSSPASPDAGTHREDAGAQTGGAQTGGTETGGAQTGGAQTPANGDKASEVNESEYNHQSPGKDESEHARGGNGGNGGGGNQPSHGNNPCQGESKPTGNGSGYGNQPLHKQFESGQAQGNGNDGGGGNQPSHGNNPAGGDSHSGKKVDDQPGNPGNSGNSDSNKTTVDPECEQGLPLANTKQPETNKDSGTLAYPSNNAQDSSETPSPSPTPMPAAETGGDADHGYGDQKPSEPKGDRGATEEPDCDEKLTMPNDAATPSPSPTPTPAADADVVGGDADNVEDPDCEQKLPYSYDTKAPEASQGSDCDDELSIADKKATPATGSEAPGNKDYGGGAHGHGHGGYGEHHQDSDNKGDQKYQGGSYSFKSAMGNPYRESENNSSEGAGVVLPYSGA